MPSVPLICRHLAGIPLQDGRTESISRLDAAALGGGPVQRAGRGVLASEPQNATVFSPPSSGASFNRTFYFFFKHTHQPAGFVSLHYPIF